MRRPMRRQYVVIAVAVALALSLLVAAQGGPGGTQRKRTTVVTLSAVDRAQAQTLLRRSWAASDAAGFFVDYAGPPGTPLSLYATTWWLEVLRESRAHSLPLVGDEVGTWLPAVVRGEPGLADTTGTPALQRLDLATMLATRMGLHLDTGAVVQQLELLRSGSRYRTATTDKKATWAATALAVRVLVRIDSPLPAEVSQMLAKAIDKTVTDTDPNDLISYTVPLLVSMSPVQVQQHVDGLRVELVWLRSQLRRLSGLERVSLAAQLAPLVVAVNGKPWPSSEVCPGASELGAIAGEAGRPAEPHALADALGVGCLVAFAVPPALTSGWPNDEAVASAPAASYSGYRLAKLADVGEQQYATGISNEVKSEWLPNASGEEVLQIAALALVVGTPAPPTSQFGSKLLEALGDNSTAGLPSLQLAVLNGTIVREQGQVEKTPRGGVGDAEATNVYAAAADEFRYRLTKQPRFEQVSRATLTALSLGNLLYADKAANVAARRPSLVATAIAAWSDGRSLAWSTIESGHFCSLPLACSTTPQDPGSATSYQLQALAIAVEARLQRAPAFPTLV